jgi:hypothetical protein
MDRKIVSILIIDKKKSYRQVYDAHGVNVESKGFLHSFRVFDAQASKRD